MHRDATETIFTNYYVVVRGVSVGFIDWFLTTVGHVTIQTEQSFDI